MKRSGQLAFLAAVAGAWTLYALTAPDGLPWNGSSHLALAYLGEIVRLPVMPHRIWGFHVQVFGGSVALAVFMAAMAAGLLAAVVNRYLGWRVAAGAALAWIFLPPVWNRAITGERSVCLAAMVVVVLWAVNAVMLWATRRVRAARKSAPAIARVGGDVLGAPSAHDELKKQEWRNRIVGWIVLGAAGLFAAASASFHDYRLGEAASVFAKGVVEAAGGRIVVMNGVVDDQIVRELESRVGAWKASFSHATRVSRPLCEAADKGDATFLSRENKDVARHSPTPTQDSDSLPPTHNSNFFVSFRADDAYRTNLVAWAKREWPAETNLWVAAQVSPQAFVEAAAKRHPERFYTMSGGDTTLEQWERRWKAFQPYLKSSDPFVSVARRMFGYEGNGIANAMLEEGEVGLGRRSGSTAEGGSGSAAQSVVLATREHTLSDARSRVASATEETARHPPTPAQNSTSSTAWQLYKRIYEEVDPGNFSALVNMSEMIRRGCSVSGDERKKAQERLETFFKDVNRRKHMREIARASGPVRTDHEMMEKMAAEAKKRIAAKISAGEKIEYSPEILSLVEWNNEMVRLMGDGELVRAGRIARAILSNSKWREFVPANAVMGAVAASEGDYVASESFFRTALAATNKVAAVTLNDFADTLMHLGKLDEAEKVARRAVAEADEKFWVARLTLAQVLEKKMERRGGGGEVGELLKSVLKHAPAKVCGRIRKEHREFLR